MEENRNNVGAPQPEEEFNLQEILFRYLIHWPWFVVSILFCVVCAFAYLKTTTPVYNVSATVLIKDEEKGGGATMASELEKMGLGGMMNTKSNVDNEIEVLRSKSLALEVVEQLNLYVSYRNEDDWLSKEMYRTSPVLVSLTSQEASKLPAAMIVKMNLLDSNKIAVEIEVGKKKYQKQLDKLPAVFPTDEGTVAFLESTDSLSGKWGQVQKITATIGRPMAVAKGYSAALSLSLIHI